MLIDCDHCVVRGLACGDCVVSVLLGSTPEDAVGDVPPRPTYVSTARADLVRAEPVQPEPVQVDSASVAALDALAACGLVPPLRLLLPDTGTG